MIFKSGWTGWRRSPSTDALSTFSPSHSTRKASFCLSELQYAIDNHVPIFPVLLEKCKIPIEIYPLHRLDIRPGLPVEQHPEPYRRLLQTLVVDMEGQVEKRLVQQKIIEGQSPQETPPQGLPPVANLPKSKTPPKSPAVPGILKSRWVWVVRRRCPFGCGHWLAAQASGSWQHPRW